MNHEVSQLELKMAVQRYPGLPLPLALSKYKLDQLAESSPTGPLHPGLAWGGLHLERVGAMVQKLAEAMYHQGRKSITVKIQSTDFPESWDPIELEIVDVDRGAEEEIARMGLAGWPCCSCDQVISGEDRQASFVMLNKMTKWSYPTWGNILYGTQGRAIASQCGRCITAGMKPLYAVKKTEEGYERVGLWLLGDAE